MLMPGQICVVYNEHRNHVALRGSSDTALIASEDGILEDSLRGDVLLLGGRSSIEFLPMKVRGKRSEELAGSVHGEVHDVTRGPGRGR